MKKIHFNSWVAISAAMEHLAAWTRRPGIVRRLALTSCAIASLLLPDSPSRAIDFSFNYADTPGTGFLDPALGQQRRVALEYAGTIWGDLIRSSYVGETILIRATFEDYAADAEILASASPIHFSANFATSNPQYRSDTYFAQSLANHMVGSDGTPGQAVINIKFNSRVGNSGPPDVMNTNFYYGTDGAVPNATDTDFVTVALHEICHGLGCSSSFRQDGSYGVDDDGTYIPGDDTTGLPLIYDRFVVLGPGGTMLTNQTKGARAVSVVSDNLYWNGNYGFTGNGGAPPELYAPLTFESGSTVSHLDPAVHPGELMGPAYSGVDHIPGPIVRGMLRDMGWSISIAPSTVTWTGIGTDDNANNVYNWSPDLPLPGDTLNFGASPRHNIRFDLPIPTADAMNFTVGASAYTIELYTTGETSSLYQGRLTLTGDGVTNSSGVTQDFVIDRGGSHGVAGGDEIGVDGSRLVFSNSASAGNDVSYHVLGGVTSFKTNPSGVYLFLRTSGGSVVFNNSASAGSATFVVDGGAGNGGIPAYVEFHNNSTAANGTFTNNDGAVGGNAPGHYPSPVCGFGGQTTFYDTASAGAAIFSNIGQSDPAQGGTGGITNFRDNSTAAAASFNNRGATADLNNVGIGGATQFFGHATAAAAHIVNEPSPVYNGGGKTYFGDDSTAGNALIDNVGGNNSTAPGATSFYVRSTAGDAIINNRGLTGGGPGGQATSSSFHDDSTAGSATIHNFSGSDTGGITQFTERATAGNAHIILEPDNTGGMIVFKNDSSAGSAHLDASANHTNGIISFRNQSTAESAVISLGPNSGYSLWAQFYDTASAGNATIRAESASAVQFYQGASAANSNITVHSDATLYFFGNYDGGPINSAGSATIHILGGSSNIAPGGSAYFGSNATASTASFTVDGAQVTDAGAGTVYFGNLANAGSATIQLKSSPIAGAAGGSLFFSGGSGPSAHVITEAGSVINVAGVPGSSIGWLEGAGDIHIINTKLTVGGLGQDATLSGLISGSGGSLIKTGPDSLTLTGANTYTGLTTVEQGTLILNGSVAGDAVAKSGSTFKGTANVNGALTCEAGSICSPGTSPGTFTLGGLNLMSGSTLQFELGAVRDHIVLTNSGNVALGGLLDLTLIGGFDPAVGQTFSLFEGSIGSITGTFSAVNTPIVNGHALNVVYGANSVTLELGNSGDFNGDSKVDAADYVVWRKGLGTTYTQDDYNAWRAHFGQTSGTGSGEDLNSLGSAPRNVPEPSSLTLLVVCFVAGRLIREFRKP